MGQGQPRVIIWTILVVLVYIMLHTKFQGHPIIGSGEEDFLRFLPYMAYMWYLPISAGAPDLEPFLTVSLSGD